MRLAASSREYGRRATSAEPSIRRHRPDYVLLIIISLLIAIGMIVVYAISPALGAGSGSAGSHYVSRQLIAIALSIVAFFVTARIPLAVWQRWQKPLLIAAGIGTLIALVTPVVPEYPAHRWIRFGGLSLQSVEILKFALIIALSNFFAHRLASGQLNSYEKTFKPLGILLLILMVVVAGPSALHGQSDLGSTAVIIAIMAAMGVMAGMPVKPLLYGGAALALMVVFVITISPYRRDRLTAFTHPDCLTTGYQACQALVATGSGGLVGKGLGGGASSYGYLPQAQNDSIFAIYAEKFGFVGCAVLLGLFVGLFARLARIMERAPDDFSRFVVVGIFAWLSVQTMINIGAMIGLLPLKGITLPFISYGGTSVLFVGAAMGLVFQISHYTSLRNVVKNGQRSQHESSDDRRRVRGAYHPDLSSRA